MSWDSVPWFVGGGAEHSPEVARLLAYAATSGAEGLVEPGDLKVQPLAVPGGSVRVAPGAALIRNRATGGDQQTYVARMATEDVVAIAATGSGAGRSDLIVARIEDPWLAGEPWQDPVDPKVGPYVFTRVISNVPAGTTSVAELNLGFSAIALARVDIPASTATITAGMITDLRALARPRTTREVFMSGPGTSIVANAGTWTDWNVYNPQVRIPEWATHVDLLTTVSGVLIWETYTDGDVRNMVGSLTGSARGVDFDNPQGPTRETIVLLAGVAVPPELRGTVQTIKMQAQLGRGRLDATTGTHVLHDVQFSERAV